MMKKYTAVLWKIVAGLVLSAMILSACAPATVAPTTAPTQPPAPTTAPTQPPPPTAVPTAKPTEKPKPVDIEIWAQATSTQAPAIPEDWVGWGIIRDKLNINLKYTIIPTGADGETKINAAAAANAPPDLMQAVSTTNARNKVIDLNKQGLIVPVDDMLKLMPNRVKTHYYDPNAMAMGQIAGKQMALVEVPNLPRREGLAIRKDWLDKLGLQMPTTIDELFAVAKAFTEQDPDGNGKNDTYGLGGFFDGSWGAGNRFAFFFGAFGVPDLWDWANLSTNFQLAVRTPNFYKAVAEFRKWNEAKVIDPDWATINRDEFRIRWPQGRYGIMWEDFCALSCVANYPKFDNNFPNGVWVPLAAPKGPDGQAYYGAYGALGAFFVVSQKAADAGKTEAIAKLLEWMASDEGYYRMGFGVENVNYKLVNGVVSTAGLADPTKAWNAEKMASYTQMRNQLIYNNNTNEVAARYPDFVTEKSKKPMSPMAFYKFDSTQPWLDSTAGNLIVNPKNRADLQRFYNENFQAFALGSKPLNETTWAEFLKTLDSSLAAKDWEASAKKNLQDAGVIK